MIATTCKHCSASFLAHKNKLEKGLSLFCSQACSSKGQQQRRPSPETAKQFACGYCQCLFLRSPSKMRGTVSGLHFCSRKCKDLAQRIEGLQALQPKHYGTGQRGYRTLALRQLENKCARCDYLTHPEILEVHHRDCDRSNNNLNNLEILCPTCHAAHHFLSQNGKWR